MLSIYTLKSASQAAQYYEQGDYYIKGDTIENNVWFGNGAKDLGLTGAVDAKQFKKLLEGELPNGTKLGGGYDERGNQKHRPGYDLTFSACKSASILAVVGGDQRITQAHLSAVKSVLTNIEDTLAGTRIKTQGNVKIVKTNNITAALFNHTDSRLLDPNLHTHCIILNITKLGDAWRTIYGDDFYKLKMAMGLEYRMNFAQNLMKLGYDIEQTSKNGLFEIANVPKDLITHFSKRRIEIEKIINDSGRDGSDKITITLNRYTKYEKQVNTTVSSMATIYSRAKKKTLQQDELQQHWTQQLQLAGFDRKVIENFIDQAKIKGEIVPDNPGKTLNDALPLAIEHLTARKHQFLEKELVYAIKSLCLKSNVSDKQITNEINRLKSCGNILETKDGILSTKESLNLEIKNEILLEKGRDSTFALLPIVASFLINNLIKDQDKIGALKILLSSRDRYIGIESSNENDMRNLLKTFCKFTPHCNHYVLSKNLNVAQTMAAEIGAAKAFSTSEFITYTNRLVTEKDSMVRNLSSVWIINRAQQLSHREINFLLQNAEQLGSKVLFTGDSFRTNSLHRSNPFKQLIDHKLNTINIKPNLNIASDLIKDEQISKSLDVMQSNNQIVYIENPEQRFKDACAYVASQDTSTLLVQNKTMVKTANTFIREHRETNGKLSGDSYQLQILAPIALSPQEKAIIVNFNLGDVIRFNATIQNTEFKQGSYYTITSINEKRNTICLTDKENAEITLNFSSSIGQKITAYRPQNLHVKIGEHLTWTDNTPNKINITGCRKGDSLVVVGVNANNIQISSKHGVKTVDVSNRLAQHLDYNYARSINSYSKDHNISGAILIDNKCFPQVSARDMYTTLKSFSNDPKVFASSKNELILYMEANSHKTENVIDAFKPTMAPDVHNQTTRSVTSNYNANNAVEYAIAKLAEREAVFRKQDLEYIAYSYDIKTPVKDLEKSILDLEKNGTLISVELDKYVFKEIYDCERECLSIQDRGMGKLQPIISHHHLALADVKANHLLTNGQKEAITACLTSTDRVTLIQGVAGSGKTTMLKEVKTLARDNGFELIGLANTASAKLNLHLKSIGAIFNPSDPRTFADSGMQAQTLASFLLASSKLLETNPIIAKSAYPSNIVLVLDEASLVSARNMRSLLNITEKLDLRLVVIGDDRQLPAIEASRIFSLMLGTSSNAVNMNINTRLKTPESLEIMQLIYASNLNPNLLNDAFDKLQQNIVEIPSKQERLQLMANYYTAMPLERRNEVLPMMPENKDRVDFNHYVRDNLKIDGTLSGHELRTNVMVAKDLTISEKNYALSFEKDDFVRFNSNVERLGIKSGDYYQVVDANTEKLILRNDSGNVTSWNPFKHSNGHVEVYRQESRGIMAGDVIRWRRNFENKGIINSETAKVLKVSDTSINIQLNNGVLCDIDINDRNNQHFDHAYGSTVHVAQGLDRKNPIGLLDGPKPYMVEIESVARGSVIVIPGNTKDKTMSKVGQVIETNIDNGKSEIKVVDREGREQTLNNKFIEMYPDFEKAKHLPLSNICNFLVQATRGDDFIIFVDNVEGYKASLKYSLNHLKQTALEMIDVQQGLDVKNKVAQMTSKVFGLAKPDELKDRLIKMQIDPRSREVPNKNLILNFEAKRNKLSKDQFHIQLNNLKQTLNQDPLRFASQILGSPVTKTPTYANFAMGNDKTKGNLTLDIAGARAGLWCDHRTSAGGDLVSLYATQYGLSYCEAAKKLFSERNIKELTPSTIAKSSLEAQKLQQINDEQARAKRIKQATQLYNSAQSIKGTLAEKYLGNIRGIKTGIPDNFKFAQRCWHKDLRTQKPALLVPAYDENGKLQSVNRIYLGQDANKLNVLFKSAHNTTMPATQKAVLGPSKSATVFIHKSEGSSVTYLTEGVENGLSIRQSISAANISSCFGIGQLKNITLSPETKTVVICADNDGANLSTKKALEQSVANFLAKGIEVKLALPIGKGITNKYDYNQMLTDKGSAAITASMQQAVVIKAATDLGGENTPLYQSYARLHEQQFGKNLEPVSKIKDIEREL